jgi:trans-2,3-dihydro-3-hydroxyanthranilate isomerase
MLARRYTLIDVFTSVRLQGNPLAVVHDADDVPDSVMHAFARETRLAETSYVQTPSVEGADYRNRIWMMSGEVPFAGHPSLGVAAAVARERGETSVSYVQETHAGLQPIDVELAAGGAIHVSMLQEPATFGPELDPSDVLGAVGLSDHDADPELPCQAVSTGAFHVLAPVRDATVLAGLWPDYDRIASLLAPFAGGLCLYVTAVDTEAGTARARSFATRAEMGEDAATGSAAGPLCAYLAQRTGLQGVTVSQGVEMGRASRLVARLEGDRVRVGGDAVVVADGSVFLDA